MNLSEYMIEAACALRNGAAENIVRLAMRADDVPVNRIETMILWCKMYNKKLAESTA